MIRPFAIAAIISLYATMTVLVASYDETTTTNNNNDDALVSRFVEPWPPATNEYATVQDLHREYDRIFQRGNRNAASHRWATFLLDRSDQMTEATLMMFFSGFCAVSGSPVRPTDYNRYRLTLPKLGGGFSTGYMHYCCWPCVCDTQDFIRVDTKTIRLSNGTERSFQFAVIGNPCDKPEELSKSFTQPFYDHRQTTIAESAKEIHCLSDGSLEGATLSDHGYIIISMFFDSEDAIHDGMDGIAPGALEPLQRSTPGRMSAVVRDDKTGRKQFQDEREYKFHCAIRAKNGYNSGMGEIFRKVCSISPIDAMAVLSKPTDEKSIGATTIRTSSDEEEGHNNGAATSIHNGQTATDDDLCSSESVSGKNKSQPSDPEEEA